MNKFSKLLKMELTKIIKRKSTYIMIGLLVILSILNPLIEKIFESIDFDFDTGYLDSVIDYEKSENAKLKGNEKTVSDIKLKIYDSEKEIINLEKQLNLNEFNYLYESFNNYRDSYYKKMTNDLIKEYTLDDVTEAFQNLEYYIPFEYLEANYKILLKNENDFNDYLSEVNKEFEKAKNKLENSKNVTSYLSEKIEEYEDAIKENEKYLKELKDKNEIENTKIINEGYEYDIQILKYTKEMKEAEKDTFDSNYLKLCMNIVDTNDEYYIAKVSKMDEKSFTLSLTLDEKNIMTYEKYLKLYDFSQESKNNEIMKMDYALKNKLYESVINTDNFGRELVKRGYSTGTIFILISIMVSIIVAKEFTTGTIRLLMIRPVKRWKILIAKFLSILILTLIMTIIAYTALILSVGIMYSFESFKAPVLDIVNGIVVEKNLILESIKYTLLTLISTFSLISIALALAVFSRSPAATIATSLAIYFGSFLLNIEMLNAPKKWMQYTIIPYIDFSNFNGNEMYSMIIQNNIKFGLDMTVDRGVITFLVLSIILIAISIIRFNKMDIKNT